MEASGRPDRLALLVGAIVAALLVLSVVSLTVIRTNRSPAPRGNQIAGSCNVQGSGNACIGPFDSFDGGVSVKQLSLFTVYWEGALKDLPEPPNYEYPSGHCNDWTGWMEQNKLYPMDQSWLIEARSNSTGLVAVKKIDAQIVSKRKAKPGVVIQCLYGGDFASGYSANVDTMSRKTRVAHFSETGTEFFDMPPGAVVAKGKSWEGLQFSVTSEVGYLYEGAIRISYEVDGIEKSLTIGSKRSPARWFGVREGNQRPNTTYDWDIANRKWVTNDIANADYWWG